MYVHSLRSKCQVRLKLSIIRHAHYNPFLKSVVTFSVTLFNVSPLNHLLVFNFFCFFFFVLLCQVHSVVFTWQCSRPGSDEQLLYRLRHTHQLQYFLLWLLRLRCQYWETVREEPLFWYWCRLARSALPVNKDAVSIGVLKLIAQKWLPKCGRISNIYRYPDCRPVMFWRKEDLLD